MAKPTDDFKDAASGKKQPQATVGIESIKQDQPKATLEYNGPGGSGLRADMAAQRVGKDHQAYNQSRADKYVKADKAKGASLSQEFAKAKGKGQGIG